MEPSLPPPPLSQPVTHPPLPFPPLPPGLPPPTFSLSASLPPPLPATISPSPSFVLPPAGSTVGPVPLVESHGLELGEPLSAPDASVTTEIQALRSLLLVREQEDAHKNRELEKLRQQVKAFKGKHPLPVMPSSYGVGGQGKPFPPNLPIRRDAPQVLVELSQRDSSTGRGGTMKGISMPQSKKPSAPGVKGQWRKSSPQLPIALDAPQMVDVLPQRETHTGNGVGVREVPLTQSLKSWADMVQSNSPTSRLALSYVPPLLVYGYTVVKPCAASIEESDPIWEDCIVGYFVGKKLPFKSVESIARRLWGKEGLLDVLANASGFYFFRISDVAARRRILEAGPWLFAGRPLIVQQWTNSLILCKETHSRIPLWVKFWNVPLSMWSSSGLSHVASAVGKPMHADVLTEQMKRIAFARICVEVEASKPLLDNFVLDLHGVEHMITVEYQWKPQICRKCNVFGHSCSVDPVKANGTVPAPSEPTRTLSSNGKPLQGLSLGNPFDVLTVDLPMEDGGSIAALATAAGLGLAAPAHGPAPAAAGLGTAAPGPGSAHAAAGLGTAAPAPGTAHAAAGLGMTLLASASAPAAAPAPVTCCAPAPVPGLAPAVLQPVASATLCALADPAPALIPADAAMIHADPCLVPAPALTPVDAAMSSVAVKDGVVLGPAAFAATVLGLASPSVRMDEPDVNFVGSPKTRLQKGRKEKKKENQSKSMMKNLVSEAPSVSADDHPSL